MYPISRQNPSITQGPKASGDFNKLCNDIIYDINSLFESNNQNAELASYNMDVVMLENFFLQSKIAELESQIADINSTLTNGARQKTISFRNRSSLRDHMETDAYVDIVNGVVMNSHQIISKNLVKNQDDEYVVPEELTFEVFESVNGGSYVPIDDDYIYDTFDGDPNSVWFHTTKLESNTSIDKLYIAMHIKLPMTYLNNTMVNSINIKPFPEYSMRLTSVKYTAPNSTKLENLTTLDPNVTMLDLQSTILHFPPVEMENVYLFFEQPCYFLDDNFKYFYYGMQEIGINFLDFTTDVSYIVNEINLPEGEYFYSINQPINTAAVGCPSDIQGLVYHWLYFDPNKITAGVAEHEFGEPISENYSTVYILSEIRQGPGYSPVLSDIRINYIVK